LFTLFYFPFCVYFPAKNEKNADEKNGEEKNADEAEEGTRHFMVNIVEPQFNLHSEDANVSYRVRFHFK